MTSNRRASAALLVAVTVLSACSASAKTANLRALDVRDGSTKWSTRIGADHGVAVATSSGTVVVEAGRCNVAAVNIIGLDATTGRRRWQHTGIANGSGNADIGAGAGVVAVRESQGKLVGLDVTTGDVVWTAAGPPGDPIGWPVVADTPALVLVRNADTLHALDRATGHERWQSAPTSGGQVIGLTADESTAVLTMFRLLPGRPATNEIIAYDLADGTQRWHLDVPVWDHVFPARTSDGLTVYTGGSITDTLAPPQSDMVIDDLTTAYDTLTGTEMWAMHNIGERPHTAPVVSDGNVYVSADDALVALDARSGRERWRHPTMSPFVLAGGAGVVLITPSGSANPGESELLAAQDGAVRWHGALDGGVAAVGGDAIFVSDGGATGQCGD
jgi:outer membrane protein assembly factor BamB